MWKTAAQRKTMTRISHIRFRAAVPLLPVMCMLLIRLGAVADELYHLVRIPLSPASLAKHAPELGLPLEDAHIDKSGNTVLPLERADCVELRQRGIPFTVIREDLESYYADVCGRNLAEIAAEGLAKRLGGSTPRNMGYGSQGGFYSYDEILDALDKMHRLYPSLCTAGESIGETVEGRSIRMVKISDNPGIDEDEPEVMYDATHHAREVGSYTVLLYFMWHILERYGTDPEATYLIDNRELYFVPVINVDGVLYNERKRPDGGGLWRKNRRDNGDGEFGVDLNRNYPYGWGGTGSDSRTRKNKYRGPSAASEPETQAIIQFVNGREFVTALSNHSYGGYYLYPFGCKREETPHRGRFHECASLMAAKNGYTYGPVFDTMYPASGISTDWQYGEHGIIAFACEVGNTYTHYWPGKDDIMPDCAANLPAHLLVAWNAGAKLEMEELVVADRELTPGGSEEVYLSVYNRGWVQCSALDASLSSSDPYLSVDDAKKAFGTIAARGRGDNISDPFIVNVDPSLPAGHVAELTVTLRYGGVDFPIAVRPRVGSAPRAERDRCVIAQDSSAVVDVLDNDTDADNDSLRIVSFTRAANGTVSSSDTTLLLYIPRLAFAGADTFSYTIADMYGWTDSAEVIVEVAPTDTRRAFRWPFTGTVDTTDRVCGVGFTIEEPVRITHIMVNNLLKGAHDNVGLWEEGEHQPLHTFSLSTGSQPKDEGIAVDVPLEPGTYRLAGVFDRSYRKSSRQEFETTPGIEDVFGAGAEGNLLAYPSEKSLFTYRGYVNFRFEPGDITHSGGLRAGRARPRPEIRAYASTVSVSGPARIELFAANGRRIAGPVFLGAANHRHRFSLSDMTEAPGLLVLRVRRGRDSLVKRFVAPVR